MAYVKQNFVAGDILPASQLNAMDDQIAKSMERIVLTLSGSGGNVTLKDKDGANVTFDDLIALVQVEPNYVVVKYGNTKLRPQYASSNEIHANGDVDNDSSGTWFNRMVMTPTRLDVTKFYVADKSDIQPEADLTQEQYDALTDAEKNNGTYYNIIEG